MQTADFLSCTVCCKVFGPPVGSSETQRGWLWIWTGLGQQKRRHGGCSVRAGCFEQLGILRRGYWGQCDLPESNGSHGMWVRSNAQCFNDIKSQPKRQIKQELLPGISCWMMIFSYSYIDLCDILLLGHREATIEVLRVLGNLTRNESVRDLLSSRRSEHLILSTNLTHQIVDICKSKLAVCSWEKILLLFWKNTAPASRKAYCHKPTVSQAFF